MSVYKELGYEIQELISRQHALYNDACDVGFWASLVNTLGTEMYRDSDRTNVKAARELVEEDKEFGKISTKNGVWTFEKECLEYEEDGVKIGFGYRVRSGKDSRGNRWVRVEAFDLNTRRQIA
jgi:hypothetical protein